MPINLNSVVVQLGSGVVDVVLDEGVVVVDGDDNGDIGLPWDWVTLPER